MMLNHRFAAFNDDHLNISNPETNQSTRPNSLPIVGNDSTGEISLAISSSSQPNVFALVGKELKLISPLDRDHQDISSVILQVKILDRSGPMLFIRVTQLSIYFINLTFSSSIQVSCTNLGSGRRRNIPVIVRISDINDNPPVFRNSSYRAIVPEVMHLSLFPSLCFPLVESRPNKQTARRETVSERPVEYFSLRK